MQSDVHSPLRSRVLGPVTVEIRLKLQQGLCASGLGSHDAEWLRARCVTYAFTEDVVDSLAVDDAGAFDGDNLRKVMDTWAKSLASAAEVVAIAQHGRATRAGVLRGADTAHFRVFLVGVDWN